MLVAACLERPLIATCCAFLGWRQVDEERKEAEAIKERVAKDEAAVATRQEEVLHLFMSEMSTKPQL